QSRRDDLVVQLARARELSFLEIQIRELLLVADRRVVDDDPFELLDAPAAGQRVERPAQQFHVGYCLGNDVDERTESSADQDDPEPIPIGPAPQEMEDGCGLQDEAPRIEQTGQTHTLDA